MIKKYRSEFILCLILGYFGAHKFYDKKYGMGILYFLTFGLFVFGWIIDIFILGKLAFFTSEEELEIREKKIIEKREEELRKREEFKRIMESKPTVSKKYEDNVVRCPKCGSTSITAHKKGFGLAKGAAGFFTLGAYGVVAAGIGKNKVLITCLNCGKRWKPGRR